MNPGMPDDHTSIRFYDGDYPSPFTSIVPENCDGTIALQGLAHDIDRFLEIAAVEGGPVLDLCCGTGRISIPLARKGFAVTGVDISAGMLERAGANLQREEPEVRERIEFLEQDVSELELPTRDYPLAVCGFNSLMCIPAFDLQCKTLAAVAKHLAAGGLLVLDLMNALQLKINGDPVATPFFTRRNPESGNTYTRFAMMDAFDADQRQRLHGWYDEIMPDGTVHRELYSMHWRPIFRFEIQLMLERAGFRIEAVEGGHQKESFEAKSQKMFVLARKEKA